MGVGTPEKVYPMYGKKVQGATSAPKARIEEGLTGQAPVPNTELIDKEIDGGRNSREGVPNVW